MIGVGTNKVQLNSMKNCFCSFLGRDQESFGYSYLGYIQHSGETRNYGSCFGQGSLVGMHLDTWRGTLEFYLNRKPLGKTPCYAYRYVLCIRSLGKFNHPITFEFST